MSDMLIRPYEGIGPIRFGMQRAEVRAALGGPFREFKKTVNSVTPTDAFPTLGVHVYYKLPGSCEAVEVASPAQAILFGRELVGSPFQLIYDWLRELDVDAKLDDTGLTSLRFGVGIYVPTIKNDLGVPVEAVIVFERGYYP